ncbi:hypothetical protein ACFE04_009307 [Oxalis oulophora]
MRPVLLVTFVVIVVSKRWKIPESLCLRMNYRPVFDLELCVVCSDKRATRYTRSENANSDRTAENSSDAKSKDNTPIQNYFKDKMRESVRFLKGWLPLLSDNEAESMISSLDEPTTTTLWDIYVTRSPELCKFANQYMSFPSFTFYPSSQRGSDDIIINTDFDQHPFPMAG